MSVDPSKSEPAPTTDEIKLAEAIAAGRIDGNLEDPAPGIAESPVIREARRRRRTVLLMRKLVITLLGLLILGAGVAMIVLPGPGVLAIVLGLFVLSLEYEWAARRFDQLRDKAVGAAHTAASNKLGTALSVVGALTMIVGGILWALHDELPLSSWFTGGTVVGGGVLALGTIVWSVLDLRRHRARQAGGPGS
jgi:hypothetical protein